MIVRNEERCLARCLESVTGAVDALYVTDTGSTDRTIAIARQFGAVVRQFEWCDDFAAARNFSIAGVPEDWILFIDADDLFPPGEAAKVRALLRGAAHVAYELSYELMPDHTPVPARRIFRNGLGLRFEGLIHENLRNSLGRIAGATTGRMAVTLRHTGYTPESMPNKLRRNLPLLEREWERCAAVGERVQHGYVGKELAHALILRGRAEEGEKLLLALVDEMVAAASQRAGEPWEMATLALLLWHYHEAGRDDEALQACRRLDGYFGRQPLFGLYRGLARFRVRDFVGALADLRQFERDQAENPLEISLPEAYTSAGLWDLLGQCLLQTGEPRQAGEYFARCVRHCPDHREYETKLHLAQSCAQ